MAPSLLVMIALVPVLLVLETLAFLRVLIVPQLEPFQLSESAGVAGIATGAVGAAGLILSQRRYAAGGSTWMHSFFVLFAILAVSSLLITNVFPAGDRVLFGIVTLALAVGTVFVLSLPEIRQGTGEVGSRMKVSLALFLTLGTVYLLTDVTSVDFLGLAKLGFVAPGLWILSFVLALYLIVHARRSVRSTRMVAAWTP